MSLVIGGRRQPKCPISKLFKGHEHVYPHVTDLINLCNEYGTNVCPVTHTSVLHIATCDCPRCNTINACLVRKGFKNHKDHHGRHAIIKWPPRYRWPQDHDCFPRDFIDQAKAMWLVLYRNKVSKDMRQLIIKYCSRLAYNFDCDRCGGYQFNF